MHHHDGALAVLACWCVAACGCEKRSTLRVFCFLIHLCLVRSVQRQYRVQRALAPGQMQRQTVGQPRPCFVNGDGRPGTKAMFQGCPSPLLLPHASLLASLACFRLLLLFFFSLMSHHQLSSTCLLHLQAARRVAGPRLSTCPPSACMHCTSAHGPHDHTASRPFACGPCMPPCPPLGGGGGGPRLGP